MKEPLKRKRRLQKAISQSPCRARVPGEAISDEERHVLLALRGLEARKAGRPVTLSEIEASLRRLKLSATLAAGALAQLEARGVVLQRDEGWNIRVGQDRVLGL